MRRALLTLSPGPGHWPSAPRTPLGGQSRGRARVCLVTGHMCTCVYRHVHSGTHAYPHHAGVKAWCGTWLAGPSLSLPAPRSPKAHSSCKMLSKAPPACPRHDKQVALPFQLLLPSPLPHPHPEHLLLSALAGSPGPTCPAQHCLSQRLCSQAACLLPWPVSHHHPKMCASQGWVLARPGVSVVVWRLKHPRFHSFWAELGDSMNKLARAHRYPHRSHGYKG